MNDYTWPSVYFAYFFFAICLALAVFFFFRSRKDGYWSKESEKIKYQVFDGTDVGQAGSLRPSGTRPSDTRTTPDLQESPQ